MSRTTRASIDRFLALDRIAVAGVSRRKDHFSRALFQAFVERGYTVLPVNPEADEIDGLACAPRVSAIHPAPRGVLIMTSAQHSAAVVEDCARAGVEMIWLYRALGQGAVSGDALGVADAHGLETVAGECPFMYFPKPGFPHNLHYGWKALTGSLPR